MDESLSCIQLFAAPWTVAHQAPLSMGSSRQEYWSGLPCPSPRDLPDPGIEPESPESPALVGRFFTTVPLGKQTPIRVPFRGHIGSLHTHPIAEPGPTSGQSSVGTSLHLQGNLTP